jgi:hypothetical protein
LPDPAPAITKDGPSQNSTAARCEGFKLSNNFSIKREYVCSFDLQKYSFYVGK